ncbi:pilus assembly protein TadG-related protein [Ornithinimicrobium faecis]|uniref:Pilus assembly protein TadG-related protein n=1 Tax=Ornithinimicrobium faecis TaxID=2934158 RepID=A0ABY4YR33_9MICO|nr:pilus assembly protein TadG-related protein [Ornithinimicrobium sp. HY1793]USQ78843.1 pilus assembly protein TadG-related protein [Ornithinimicrobium sp. HY1793]
MSSDAARGLRRIRGDLERGRESGQISVLLIGMASIALLLILGVVGATSVQLSRIHLLDAADAAALAAADAVDEETLYAVGLGDGVPLTTQGVAGAAQEHLARQPMPDRVLGWEVAEGTGTTDARTAVVRLTGEAEIPLISGILRQLGGSVSITVESRARSELD